jgi:hypothetical protein
VDFMEILSPKKCSFGRLEKETTHGKGTLEDQHSPGAFSAYAFYRCI